MLNKYSIIKLMRSSVTRVLSQGGQSLAEGVPMVIVGGALANTQKNVTKW